MAETEAPLVELLEGVRPLARQLAVVLVRQALTGLAMSLNGAVPSSLGAAAPAAAAGVPSSASTTDAWRSPRTRSLARGRRALTRSRNRITSATAARLLRGTAWGLAPNSRSVPGGGRLSRSRCSAALGIWQTWPAWASTARRSRCHLAVEYLRSLIRTPRRVRGRRPSERARRRAARRDLLDEPDVDGRLVPIRRAPPDACYCELPPVEATSCAPSLSDWVSWAPCSLALSRADSLAGPTVSWATCLPRSSASCPVSLTASLA
jgi:hypothetical protein